MWVDPEERDYQQTLDALYAMLPMYQRIGPAAYKKDLGNTLALCEALSNPQQTFPSIHIAGTNGKGSVAHLCASVLQAAGYRVGLYTSPHLQDFRERIKLNGSLMSRAEVIHFFRRHKDLLSAVSPSFFEATVAMAFDRFRDWKVDIAVVETGLGGRLDSTNVLQPLLSVITSIGLDHQAMLGPDLASIAAEKAGIIKARSKAIIGEYREESWPVFERRASALGTPLLRAFDEIVLEDIRFENFGWKFRWRRKSSEHSEDCFCPLGGLYQHQNIKTALLTLLEVAAFDFERVPGAIASGFAAVRESTGFRGRFDVLQSEPLLIVDGAHNREGLIALFQQLESIPHRRCHIITGSVNDKDLSNVLPCFPRDAHYYFARPDVPRGLDAEQLRIHFAEYDMAGKAFPSVLSALDEAINQAVAEDLILVCGSLFVVAEIPFERFQSMRLPST